MTMKALAGGKSTAIGLPQTNPTDRVSMDLDAFDAVLVDLDGVLTDTARIHADA